MNPESTNLLEFLLANLGDKSLQAFDEILVTNPNDIEALLARSAFLSKLEKYSESIQSYTQAIEITSGIDLANAYAGRCFNYYQLEEFQKSLDDCECALELNPNESVLWKTKGVLLFHLHPSKSIPSLQAFQKGLEINPHDQKMIELKEMMMEPIKKKLEKNEAVFQDTSKLLIEEIRERSKMDSDSYELDQIDEFLEDTLNQYQLINDATEDLFKEIPFLFLEDNKYLIIYYFIKATNLGIHAVYPSFDKEKVECSQAFFEKGKELAKDKDYARMSEIVTTQFLLEKRFVCAGYKANETNFVDSPFKIGNIPMTVLAAGAFSLVLLLSGQWLIGLIGLGITYWFWQA